MVPGKETAPRPRPLTAGGGPRTTRPDAPAAEHPHLGDALNELIEIDLEAAEACTFAAERMETAAWRARVREIADDHERHATELSVAVRVSGRDPAHKADLERTLAGGRDTIAGLNGDRAVLEALLDNLEYMVAAYAHAAGLANLTPWAHASVLRGLANGRRHRAWVIAQLGA